MTIGTATVASTKVRTTGDSVPSQSPSVRLSTVRVGNTASQIITASWCLVGGPTGVRVGCGAGDMGSPRYGLWWKVGTGAGTAAGSAALVERGDRGADVVVDEVGVDRDGGGGAFT